MPPGPTYTMYSTVITDYYSVVLFPYYSSSTVVLTVIVKMYLSIENLSNETIITDSTTTYMYI